MILIGIDCSEQYEAMLRGEWPEPHPEVVAAQRRLEMILEESRIPRAGENEDRPAGAEPSEGLEEPP